MPASRSVSPQPHRSSTKSRKRSRSRDTSRDRSDKGVLPRGAELISEDDYFLKSAEFGRWLRIEKKRVSGSDMRLNIAHDIVMYSISTSLVQTSRAGVPCLRTLTRSGSLIFMLQLLSQICQGVCSIYSIIYFILEHLVAGMESRQIIRQALIHDALLTMASHSCCQMNYTLPSTQRLSHPISRPLTNGRLHLIARV
jgi:hypothetical protein